MTSVQISALADVSVAVSTWVLVICALKGLRSWRDHLRIDQELERRRAAKRLYLAINRLLKEVISIRGGKVSPTEISEGLAKLGPNGQFLPQKPEYYVSLIDRGVRDVWVAWEEGLVSLRPEMLSQVKQFLTAVMAFREAFMRHHFTDAWAIPHLFPEDGRLVLEFQKMRSIREVPPSGEDPFQARLNCSVEPLIQQLGIIMQGPTE
jgi:hypothetical protein